MHPLVAFVIASFILESTANATVGADQHAGGDKISVSVATFNIRFNNPDDGVHAWPNRRAEVVALLRKLEPDILCIQEALHSQVLDLQEGLRGYSFRGVGRDDGATLGEYCAIFFHERRFECLQDSTLWLSPTPRTPSRGWDAALPRIVTWVRLREKDSGAEVSVFNTHFDHAGADARTRSAALLRNLVVRQSVGLPAVVAGDFNCQETEDPYAVLTEADKLFVLRDARAIAERKPIGPHGTFCGFALTEDIRGPRIDYLFVTNGIAVGRYETIRAVRSEGFLSDHCPVLATLTLP